MATERDLKRLAEAVYLRRHQLGLSQIELAERAGVSPSTVRNIENTRVGERRSPSLPNIERALGWTPGSAERILAGGKPVLVDGDAPAGYVSSRSRASIDLSQVPLDDLRAEMDRRIEALVREAAANNPDSSYGKH